MIILDTSCFFGLRPTSPGILEWYNDLQQYTIGSLCKKLDYAIECILRSGYDRFINEHKKPMGYGSPSDLEEKSRDLKLLYDYEIEILLESVPSKVQVWISEHISKLSLKHENLKHWYDQRTVNAEWKRIPKQMCDYIPRYKSTCTWCVKYRLDKQKYYTDEEVADLQKLYPCFPFAYQFIILEAEPTFIELETNDPDVTALKYTISLELMDPVYEFQDTGGISMSSWVQSLWEKLSLSQEYKLRVEDYDTAPSRHTHKQNKDSEDSDSQDSGSEDSDSQD